MVKSRNKNPVVFEGKDSFKIGQYGCMFEDDDIIPLLNREEYGIEKLLEDFNKYGIKILQK